MNNIKKIYAISLFFILGIFMINSPSLRIYAADEEGSSGDSGGGDSGGGSNDGGGGGNDGGSKDNGDSDGGGETKQGTSSNDNEGSNDNSQEQETQEQDKPDNDQPDNTEVTEIDREALKGTPEEQEKAAVEDYIHEEPGIVKPYPSTGKISDKPTPGSISNPKINLRCSHLPEGCSGGQGPHDGPTTKGKGDGWGGEGWKKGGDKGNDDWKDNNHWCKWHHCGHENHNHHKHNHHNDHSHHDSKTNTYYYYYTNDYSNNHATVILQPDYSHSNNYHDIRVVIGDENSFDTVINFAGKPENVVITGLDLNQGEQFDTCMRNLNSGETNCVTSTLHDENQGTYVDIRVP